MRRLAAALVTATLLGATLLNTAPAAYADQAGRYQQQAFTATNAQRADHGLGQLRAQDCLRKAAVRQAERMAQREQIFHQDLGALLRKCGLSTAGENVAAGYSTGRSVVNDGWMHSEGHRANILKPSYRLMGIGARLGHDGNWYVAQVFGRSA